MMFMVEVNAKEIGKDNYLYTQSLQSCPISFSTQGLSKKRKKNRYNDTTFETFSEANEEDYTCQQWSSYTKVKVKK